MRLNSKLIKHTFPQASPSCSNLATPPVFSPSSSSTAKPLAKKPSRTVHIDVYCTGSDAEDSSSSGNSSSSSHSSADPIDAPNFLELESNSTPQTVYDSNQMKLQHTRVHEASDLPRRVVASKQQNYMNSSSYGNLRDYMLSQCDSRDEVTESKQMLFEKHVGDISDGRNQMFSRPTRFSNPRSHRAHLHREQSDDCISSNYPNSSRSTVRDFTCSSISSVMAASSSAAPDEFESSWKETDFENSTKASSLCPSEHFDIDNKGERVMRSRQTDDAWKEKRWKTLNTSIMHDSIEEKEICEPDPYSGYANVSPTNVLSATTNAATQSRPIDIQTYQTESSEPTRQRFDGRGKSMELPERTIQIRNQMRSNQLWPRPEFQHVESRKITTMPAGYTRSHLMRAQKFGSVIESIRKPGHHVGPSKNPDCTCEYCRRWFAERSDHFRERASSLDITFIGRSPSLRYARNF